MSGIRIDDTQVAVPGGPLFVRRWTPAGDAAAPPLVLLHDSLGSVELWREWPALLCGRLGRRVIAYDRAGFGRSAARTAPASPDFIREEAAIHFPALREALGLARYGLFGHSVGGAMALVIAALDPHCGFVIAESAQAGVEARTLEGIRAAQARFEDPAAFARLSRWHGERARWVLEAWTRVWLDPAFAHWSLDAWLPRVRCPVLAVHGDRDEYGSTAFPARIAAGVAGPSRCVILEDCGHVPHREQPARVLDRVADFVASAGT